MPKKLVKNANITEKVGDESPTQEQIELIDDDEIENNSDKDVITDESLKPNENKFSGDKSKKIVRKAGRTLLVKLIKEGHNFDLKKLDNLEGLINKTNFTNNKTMFLTFDCNENSIKALKFLRLKSEENYSVKFSYYKLFFTINGLSDDSDYNDTKKALIDYISKDTNIQVLYCKFYCKNKKYIGCGDLTVDTIDGLTKLLSKDNGLKEFSFNSLTGVFYKYNKKEN